MTGLSSCVESWTAIMRPTTSLLPPGGKGTISRTGLFGYDCATTVIGNMAATTEAQSRTRMEELYLTHGRPFVGQRQARPPASEQGGMGKARRPGRRVPAHGPVRHDGIEREPHQHARAGRRQILPYQSLLHAIQPDARVLLRQAGPGWKDPLQSHPACH